MLYCILCWRFLKVLLNKSNFHGKTALPFICVVIRGVTLKCSSWIRSYYFVTISHKEYENEILLLYVEILYNRQVFSCSFHSQVYVKALSSFFDMRTKFKRKYNSIAFIHCIYVRLRDGNARTRTFKWMEVFRVKMFKKHYAKDILEQAKAWSFKTILTCYKMQ